MIRYGKIGESLQTIDYRDDANVPDGFIICRDRPNATDILQADGTWLPVEQTQEYKTTHDAAWKHEQLQLAAEHIERHQDSDPQAIGTEQEWREYRVQLRSYEPDPSKRKDGEHHKRPVSPV